MTGVSSRIINIMEYKGILNALSNNLEYFNKAWTNPCPVDYVILTLFCIQRTHAHSRGRTCGVHMAQAAPGAW